MTDIHFSQSVRNACMPILIVLLLQASTSRATRQESNDDNLRTTRAYWLKDAYASDVAAAVEKLFRAERVFPDEQPAIIVADTNNNVLFVDAPAADIVRVDERVKQLDARPETVWVHCRLSVESLEGSKVITRPVICCPVDNRKSTVTMGAPYSDEQHHIEARARKLDGSTVRVDITLSSKVESINSLKKRTSVTHSARVRETVQLDTPFEIKLFNHADGERYAKLMVTVRKTAER